MIELIQTPVAILTLAFMITSLVLFAGLTPLGAASLPCVTLLIGLVNFFLMPVLALAGGDSGFFGLFLTSMEWPHFAVLLYAVGVVLACIAFQKSLAFNPAASKPNERRINQPIFLGLVALCVLATIVHVGLGRLNIASDENYEHATDVSAYAFINLFFTTMISLTIIYVIRDGFGPRSVALVLAMMFLFLMVAFRYRVMLLGFGLAVAFMLTRGVKIRLNYMVGGLIAALMASNAIVTTRKYGSGVDLSKLEGFSVVDLLTSFGGEIGPVYVFDYTASNPLPEPIAATPWIVAVARLVPSFLWPDKPYPDYLKYFTAGFSDQSAKDAGIAAPQHVEMLMQFGWEGLPVLAFVYFSLACLLVVQLNKLGREARIAGCALVPAFFGFYMQNRGYFFQTLSDGLFLFGPLFLLHAGQAKRRLSGGT